MQIASRTLPVSSRCKSYLYEGNAYIVRSADYREKAVLGLGKSWCGGSSSRLRGGQGCTSGQALGTLQQHLIMAVSPQTQMRLPPEVNRILYVRNLPTKITPDQLYEIFGKYGPVRQVRRGLAPDTKGTAFVVYEDIYDAKNAVDHLNGFNITGKFLIVVYYQKEKMMKRLEIRRARQELENLKKKIG